MREFMDRDFLLESPTAKTLYHDYAAGMPIVDYHCHISPREIAENRRFDNITQVWLGGDHYKWRLMRACGVDEELITGGATDRLKFEAFAAILPRAVGNPVYHWCHLELQRYFGCGQPLSPRTAGDIWESCNRQLAGEDHRVRGLILRSGVTHIVTTDDPVDSLEDHKAIRDDETFPVRVLPGWRPDQLLYPERDTFLPYIQKLERVTGGRVTGFAGLCGLLEQRMDFFHRMGCRASDHGVNGVVCAPASQEELDRILKKRLSGKALEPGESDAFCYGLLLWLGEQYAHRGWVMEIHFGARRNNNALQFESLGPDIGYDCIRTGDNMAGLSGLLDDLNSRHSLPKTVVFSLNPGDNAAIATTLGCFHQSGVAGKLQHGAAWWFNDTKTGMEEQIRNFANLSVLSNFIGMLTDSRSFLSYTRHEYFRRILCNQVGNWVENGEYPSDLEALGGMVQDIAYRNAMAYFGLEA